MATCQRKYIKKITDIKIAWSYVCLIIVCLILGLLTLLLGGKIGLADIVRGSVAGFFFALIPFMVRMGYEEARDTNEKISKKNGVFQGIYLELFEYHEYIKDLYKEGSPNEITFIPPLTRMAWTTACINGYIEPQSELGFRLRHIYEASNNLIYLMNQAIDIRTRSTLLPRDRESMTLGLINSVRDIQKPLTPIILEAMNELSKSLNIPESEVKTRQEEIKRRILKIRTGEG